MIYINFARNSFYADYYNQCDGREFEVSNDDFHEIKRNTGRNFGKNRSL